METETCFYVTEFKLGSAAEALAQIKDKGYVDAYRDRGKSVFALGIGFDLEQRNLADWRLVPV